MPQKHFDICKAFWFVLRRCVKATFELAPSVYGTRLCLAECTQSCLSTASNPGVWEILLDNSFIFYSREVISHEQTTECRTKFYSDWDATSPIPICRPTPPPKKKGQNVAPNHLTRLISVGHSPHCFYAKISFHSICRITLQILWSFQFPHSLQLVFA